MENSNITRYFLGANSRYGFYSLYDRFTDPARGDFIWVIKGGPGCGKSSFMKKVGAACQQAGLQVEYIHCSGDPDSLDALRLPQLRTVYVDGTAPHTVDAIYPGAGSLYLDLGAFYDAGALEKRLPEIIDLNIRYKEHYARAYRCLAAAAEASPRSGLRLWDCEETSRLDRRIERLARREFAQADPSPRIEHRFLSAISCQGRVSFPETAGSQCRLIYSLDNAFGLGGYYLDKLGEIAEKSGQSAVFCHDPLDPKQLEALIFPGRSMAFVTNDENRIYPGSTLRHIRLDNMIDRDVLSAKRSEIRKMRHFEVELMEYAEAALHDAKLLHDELEAIYNPNVDFSGVYAMAQDHISWLLDTD